MSRFYTTTDGKRLPLLLETEINGRRIVLCEFNGCQDHVVYVHQENFQPGWYPEDKFTGLREDGLELFREIVFREIHGMGYIRASGLLYDVTPWVEEFARETIPIPNLG